MFLRRREQAVRIVPWGPQELLNQLHEAMAIYAAAMNYPPETGNAHAGFTATHASRPGFRAAAALSGDVLVGFGYGYTTSPGQWWHNQVRQAISEEAADFWLCSAFELCELHVQPGWQGHGFGRALLNTVIKEIPEQRVVLSTPEGDTRAWRLYRSMEFVDILRHHYFPGDSRPFAVLGRS